MYETERQLNTKQGKLKLLKDNYLSNFELLRVDSLNSPDQVDRVLMINIGLIKPVCTESS